MIIRYARVCALAILLGVQAPLYATYCVPPSPAPQQALPDPPLPACGPGTNSAANGSCATCDVCSKSPGYLASGAYINTFTDLQIPTAGMYPLSVFRRYDSGRPVDGPLGIGWSSSLTAHLYYATYLLSAPNTYTYEADIVMPSGLLYRFTISGNAFIAPAGSYDTLIKNADGTYSLALQHTRSVYRFNVDGSLASLTDDYGNAIVYSYDGSGRLQSMADAAGSGRSIQVTWGGDGRIASVSDSSGRVLKYFYDQNGTLISYSDPVASSDSSQRTTYYSYVSGRFGQVLSRIEDRWHRTVSNLTWYSDGRLQTYSDGDYNDANPAASAGEKYLYQYGPNSATKIDSLGSKSYTWNPSGVANDATRTFDVLTGAITNEIYPDGHSVAYSYNARGNVATATVAGNLTWTYTYNSTYPDAVESIISSDPTHWAGWKYTYNSGGQSPAGALASIQRVTTDGVTAATVASFTYDTKGHVIGYGDTSGLTWVYTYNAAGDLKTALQSGVGSTTYDYDALGRVITITPPGGHSTTYAYDADNRIVAVTLPPPGTVPALNFTTTIAYDAFDASTGLVSVTTTDPNGHVTTLGYDALGHMIRSVDALGNATQYAYQYKLLHSITDANGNATSYQYDANRYLVKTTFFDGAFETYSVNSTGGLLSVTDRRGQSVAYSYDSFGRLSTAMYGSAVVTYAYAGQNLGWVSDSRYSPALTTYYSYDSQWRVATETQSGGDIVTYTYDGTLDRLSSYRLDPPSGQPGTVITGTMAYDSGGRLSTLQWSPVAGNFTYTYTPDGAYSTIQLPNGQRRVFAYDDQGRLTSLSNVGINGVVLPTFTYAYDYDWTSQTYASLGNRTSVAVSGGGLIAGTTKYMYDANQQLTGVLPPGGSVRTYAYDPIGNRTNSAGLNFSYYLNANQMNTPRLRNAGYSDLTWDANGNLASEGTAAFTWDAANRLVSHLGSQYRYDYQNRRDLYTPPSGSGSPVRYVYTGMNVIAERSLDSSRTNDYLFGPGIDEPLARRSSDGSIRYYTVDGLGSVVNITNASGQILTTTNYDEWGNASADLFGYTGREIARGTGMGWYYRARYYRPDWGRFVSEDPLGSDGDNNLYAYAMNSPAVHTDPLGLKVLRCWRFLDIGLKNKKLSKAWGGALLGIAGAIFPPATFPVPGNTICMMHEFLYDTEFHTSVGSGPNGAETNETLDGASCTEVPTAKGKCAMKNFAAVQGKYSALKNNCHSAVQNALDSCSECGPQYKP